MSMATSQNGWPVIFSNGRSVQGMTSGSLPRLRKWVIPGANRHLYLRDGSVGFLLIHFALWWHEVISPLDGPGLWDEWGWAVRPVRGQSTGYSNHASGTAEDLDATQFPRGILARLRFTARAIILIRNRTKGFFRGLLTWGGDWRTPDGMHTEITEGVTMGQVEDLARELLDSPRGKRILEANPGAREVILS